MTNSIPTLLLINSNCFAEFRSNTPDPRPDIGDILARDQVGEGVKKKAVTEYDHSPFPVKKNSAKNWPKGKVKLS